MKRRKVDPRRATVMEVAYLRTGSMLKAARVVAFVIAWGTAREELGHDPSAEEYAEFWGEHPATAYRNQALFREVFDRCDTPAPLLDALEGRGATQPLDLSGVLAA